MKEVKAAFELAASLVARIPRKWFAFAVTAWVLFYVLYDFLFSLYLPNERVWYKILLMAFSMIFPATAFYVLPHYFKELKLLRLADRPALIDGKRSAVHGTLQSSAELLTAPFTKRPCLYYQYSIHHHETSTTYSGQSTDRENVSINDFAGHATIPFVLHSSVGDLRLVNPVSPTERFTAKVNDPSISANVDLFVKTTVFKEKDDSLDFLPSEEHGDYRRKGATYGEIEQYAYEGYIPEGAEVCIIGKWSSALMGLESAGIALNAYAVLKGDPRNAAHAIRNRIVKNIILALFVAVFINVFALLMMTS
jgi:hypothetical protein